jgi:hypothetical protein
MYTWQPELSSLSLCLFQATIPPYLLLCSLGSSCVLCSPRRRAYYRSLRLVFRSVLSRWRRRVTLVLIRASTIWVHTGRISARRLWIWTIALRHLPIYEKDSQRLGVSRLRLASAALTANTAYPDMVLAEWDQGDPEEFEDTSTCSSDDRCYSECHVKF